MQVSTAISDTPIHQAWRLLGVNRNTWLAHLHQIGAIYRDTGGHLHPTLRWEQNRWIVEREGSYRHPALGWRQHNRLFLTPAGLHHLRTVHQQMQEGA